VTHVLSILGPNSPDPPEFTAFAPHRRLILRFHDVIEPQPDQIAAKRRAILIAASEPSYPAFGDVADSALKQP